MFCGVVGKISVSRTPAEVEFVIVFFFEPMVAHIDGLRSFLLHCSCNDATGGLVVGGDNSWWLGVSHIDQCTSEYDNFLCVFVKCC